MSGMILFVSESIYWNIIVKHEYRNFNTVTACAYRQLWQSALERECVETGGPQEHRRPVFVHAHSFT
ncbi:hypothetical protein MAR_011510 [Mya arenaria]|uniref:Uncharacterized protein n=1 Tax=Mya arenaria TaxID=6604 RepID=A0ABY7FYJ7_MYAAR|nr:hypothetical protein MAR_011510 [Mya arenaria]